MVLHILKIVAAFGTIGTGILAAFWPSAVPGFTGVEPSGPRGVTEIRSVFGGLFIGVGATPLILGEAATYRMLGIMYLAIAVARFASMVIDSSIERSNLISLAVEIVFGIILML